MNLLFSRQDFWPPHIRCVVQNLPLEIREIHDIAINEPDRAHAGGSEIQRGRGAQPSGADEKNLRLGDLLLSFAADLRQENMPAVPVYLLFREFHFTCPVPKDA